MKIYILRKVHLILYSIIRKAIDMVMNLLNEADEEIMKYNAKAYTDTADTLHPQLENHLRYGKRDSTYWRKFQFFNY